jgi:hypothetical protein
MTVSGTTVPLARPFRQLRAFQSDANIWQVEADVNGDGIAPEETPEGSSFPPIQSNRNDRSF